MWGYVWCEVGTYDCGYYSCDYWNGTDVANGITWAFFFW